MGAEPPLFLLRKSLSEDLEEARALNCIPGSSLQSRKAPVIELSLMRQLRNTLHLPSVSLPPPIGRLNKMHIATKGDLHVDLVHLHVSRSFVTLQSLRGRLRKTASNEVGGKQFSSSDLPPSPRCAITDN